MAVLQIIAGCGACIAGIVMTHKGLYWEQVFIIPAYGIALWGIVKYNNRLCDKWENKIFGKL